MVKCQIEMEQGQVGKAREQEEEKVFVNKKKGNHLGF